jgi:hypothetical protein
VNTVDEDRILSLSFPGSIVYHNPAYFFDSRVAQAVSRQPHIAEDRVHSEAHLWRICGEQCGTGTNFFECLGFSL